ncbi:hypothetical protein J6590_075893, partial [Homalodisca vitripennis]
MPMVVFGFKFGFNDGRIEKETRFCRKFATVPGYKKSVTIHFKINNLISSQGYNRSAFADQPPTTDQRAIVNGNRH